MRHSQSQTILEMCAMKYVTIVTSCLLLTVTNISIGDEEPLTQEQVQYLAWAEKLWESLDRQQGVIALRNEVATLQVPEDFYYLDPEDTEKVLVEVWGNPPGSGMITLGFTLSI